MNQPGTENGLGEEGGLPRTSPAASDDGFPNVLRRSWFLERSTGHPHDHYELLEELGRGTFGIVHRIQPFGGGKNLVCKVVDKEHACRAGVSDKMFKEFQDEIEMLKDLDHPNVNRLVEYYEDYKNLYLVLDLAAGGDLEELICWGTVDVTEPFLAKVFRQVLEATAYCHNKDIIHKDLKPDNIMFLRPDYEQPHVVVIDFGTAELLKRTSSKFAGTPGYIAPEVWQAALGTGTFGSKCDIYSIGSMLFYCLSEAELPWFRADTTNGDFMKYAKQCVFLFKTRSFQKEFDGTFQGSCEAKDLVSAMLAHKEKERLDATECLRHHWLMSPPDQQPVSEHALRALARDARKNKVKKRFLLEAAVHISPSEVEQINLIFKDLDKNGDGILSIAELSSGFRGLGMDGAAAEALVKQLDLDGNDQIEYTEFLTGLAGHSSLQFKHALWTIFCKYDTDRSGHIDIAQLAALIQHGHLEDARLMKNEEAASRLMDCMDRDGDHRISFDELCSYLLPESTQVGRMQLQGVDLDDAQYDQCSTSGYAQTASSAYDQNSAAGYVQPPD